jgi:hypothetical protein
MNSVYLFLRLAMLAFYPDGTKISLDDNMITFRKPGWSQGVLRWTFSESREDVLQIKEHIDNALFLFKNKNLKYADSILTCVHKAVMRLKLCYINASELKDFLNTIDVHITDFINSRGLVEDATLVCQNTRFTQILDKWTFTDIQFINLNIKCILELEKHVKTEYKDQLIEKYIETIDNYTTHVNDRK